MPYAGGVSTGLFSNEIFIQGAHAMRTSLIAIALAASAGGALGQEIWSGYDAEFAKPDGADWTLEDNQDRLTDAVWITRANTRGIFNIRTEDDYTKRFSPEDTRWAIGTTADLGSLVFDCWECTVGRPSIITLIGPMVVHLVSEDIYVDIQFTQWTSGGAGGGFAYVRGARPDTCRVDLDDDGEATLFDFLEFQNLFDAGDLRADFDGDLELTLFDFLAFQNEFDAGCA